MADLDDRYTSKRGTCWKSTSGRTAASGDLFRREARHRIKSTGSSTGEPPGRKFCCQRRPFEGLKDWACEEAPNRARDRRQYPFVNQAVTSASPELGRYARGLLVPSLFRS